MTREDTPGETPRRWWVQALPALLGELGSRPTGITQAAAQQRLAREGPNAIGQHREWPLVLNFLAGWRIR